MKPAIRKQTDDDQERFSLASGLDTTDRPDQARQEFRDDADANILLGRYGVGAPVQRAPQFGDVDFDLDLHSAHIAADRVQQAMRALPAELRKKYGSSAELLDAMNSGELAEDLRTVREEREKQAAAKKVADRLSEEAERARLLASDPSWAAKLAGGGGNPPPAPPPPPGGSQGAPGAH